jgi:hypothetical protein
MAAAFLGKTSFSPLTKKEEDILAADMCIWLKNTETFVENTTKGLCDFGAIDDSIKIIMLDGSTNGENIKGAIVQYRHTSFEPREHIILVLRGSGDVAKEISEAEKNAEPTVMCLNAVSKRSTEYTEVHKGYLRKYRAIQSRIRDVIRRCPAKSQLIITGYGVSGAVARIAAVDLAYRNRIDPYHTNIPIRLITFNAPQYVGNKSFNERLDYLITDDVAYAGAWDPVSRIKPINSRFMRSPEETKWVHTDPRPDALGKTYETVHSKPPRKTFMWCIPVICGEHEIASEHDIGRMLGHLRVCSD